jgi:prepilin peptidase CpaA
MNESGTAIQWGAVLGASLVAALWDVRTRRIPNWLTMPVTLVALAAGAGRDGLPGLGAAVLGWVVLASPYIVMFALGHSVAGDAKMMGAIGAWLPLETALVVLCSVAIAGGIVAFGRTLASRERKTVLRSVGASVYLFLTAFALGSRGWGLLRVQPQEQSDDKTQLTIPYGVAIFVGVLAGAVVVQLWKA